MAERSLSGCDYALHFEGVNCQNSSRGVIIEARSLQGKVKCIMRTKTFVIISFIAILVLLATACGQSPSPDKAKLTVAVSIVPQETFVKVIAGELVEVVTMIPPGSSVETYSPNPQQLQAFSDSSIYFTMGVPSEEANILPKAKDFNKNLKIVSLAEHTALAYPDLEISPGERDPHIWLSPKRVKVMIDIIAEELSLIDPENKSTYNNNAEDYKKQLDEADEVIKESLKNIKTKTFIAYHPAFGYFADDYGLTMIALEEEGKEATPQSFRDVIDIAKEQGIKVIFYQAEVDSRQSEAFAAEIGGKTQQIAPLAADYIENLKRMADTFREVLE